MSKKVTIGRVAPVHKGAFSMGTNYTKLDVVSYNGSSYMAIADNTNVLPTDNTKWQLLAQKGDSPVKGTDYFTTSEIIEFKSDVKDAVKTDLDFDNTISGINEDISDLENNKANVSDIPDVSSFITKDVQDLTYYYKSSETYTKTEIDNKISSVYKYKGSVATYNDLPSQNLTIGDTYNVESDGSNYSWNGTTWDKLGGDIDLSDYYTKTQTDTLLGGKQNVINSSNKLSADNIDDSLSTNKLTNSIEKGTWNAKYDKPGTGIPKNDLASSVQASLDLADSALQSHQDISGKEDKSNKVTSLSSSSTDTQYPSAKCVYDLIGDIATTLDTIQGEVI